MQPLDDYILKLEQSNAPEKPIEIPQDPIQIVPKEDDPIIVISDDVCPSGHKAVCCRMWWREAHSAINLYTVVECWEYLAKLVACQVDARVWCCPAGQLHKRTYLANVQGTDCHNAYNVYIPPPPEQPFGQYHPLGDPSDPNDPYYLPDRHGVPDSDFWDDPLGLGSHDDDHEF